MAKSILKNLVLIIFAFLFGFMPLSCGQGPAQREQQRLEDSLRLEQERQELFERAGRMLDSIASPSQDSL